MYKLADLIEQKRELLATIEAWDNGRSFTRLGAPFVNTHSRDA